MSKSNQESKRTIKLILVMSAIIALFSLYMLFAVDLKPKTLAGEGNVKAEEVEIGGDFVLTDQDGDLFNSNSMKGDLSLVYFGFTYCPDICPTSLQKLIQVIDTLEKYHIKLTPIFITIDPGRDTPEILKEYLMHFHKNFIGLSGTPKQIDEVAKLYKVFYARAPESEAGGDHYMVDHSSFVYLMDKNGKYMKHFHITSTPEEIIEYIRINK